MLENHVDFQMGCAHYYCLEITLILSSLLDVEYTSSTTLTLSSLTLNVNQALKDGFHEIVVLNSK